jgi:hypothetical protein
LHLLIFIIFVVVDTQSYINITNICYENVCDLRMIGVCVRGGHLFKPPPSKHCSGD